MNSPLPTARTYAAPLPACAPCPVCGHPDAALDPKGHMERLACEAPECRHPGPWAPESWCDGGEPGYLATLTWNGAATRAQERAHEQP